MRASVYSKDMYVSVAQWIARRTSNPKVVGSNPTRDEKLFLNVKMNLNMQKEDSKYT